MGLAASLGTSADRWRLALLGGGMAAFAALILQHLYWYQVADQPRLTALASEVHEHRQSIAPQRGRLLDTNGHPLAVTITYHSAYVWGPQMRNPERTAAVLGELLRIPPAEVLGKIQQATREWKPLAQRVPAAVALQIEAAELPGVVLRPVAVREYPEGSLAPQVLGFVGAEGRGLSGLELTLDEELAGRKGLLVSERDTEGGEIVIARKQLLPPQGGADVVLTLDRQVQRAAEGILADAIRQNKARGGVLMVMDPTTGALLAVASQPTYSLSGDMRLDASQQHLYKPSPVTDTYEPGSVLKLMTVAAGLEEQIVAPETQYFDGGVALVDGTPIRNWDGKGYGSVTVRQILQYSLNTGAQWVAMQLGPDRFYQYLDRFGFGRPTGVPLSGEATGWFRTPGDPNWSRLDLATNAYGQSIAVTPMQVLAAVAALGNHGVRMEPQLVREVRGPKTFRGVEPQVAGRAVSGETARVMLDMMASVWAQPALQMHRLPGYPLAGKSGTADIAGPAGYNSGQTYASFVGLGPMPNPRFAVLVRVDQPETTWGGLAAAPAFRAMFEELFAHLRIPPAP